MGLFDLFRRENVAVTRSALDEANDPDGTSDSISQLIQQLTGVGIDGVGPFDSATKVARDALARENGDVEKAIRRVRGQHQRLAGAGGFITNLGGFATMLVAVPANVFQFYVLATRMTAATAHLRGYDLSDDRIRTAVLLTLVGSNSTDILSRAGLPVTGGAAVAFASSSLPRAALMVVQKAVGFRILRTAGTRIFSRAGRLVPVLGGAIGAGVDLAMMTSIADQAHQEFPPR
ncbi:EcsC family protein [Propioniciclava soli]|uniref:EcsC family protein n=1 Tax=Propioniciclava soli TaxID=2775081 RepID=A0ABZ3CBX2_9ACTN|nr:EcsC family protein [Propioniciclava soli]